MARLFDKILIIGLATVITNWNNVTIESIICFLIMLTLAFINVYSDKKVVRFCSLIIYIILCVAIPLAIIYAPAITYDILDLNKWYAVAFFVLSFMLLCNNYTLLFALGIVAIMFISMLLGIRTKGITQFRKEIISLRDSNEETKERLKNKNKDLMEKQDYEVYLATLRERNRIAREIHDNVGHMLSRSLLQVGALITINKDSSLEPYLVGVKDTLDLAMNNIRESVHDLHDDSIDLKNSLEDIIKAMEGYHIDLDYDFDDAPKNVKYCFISIVKEALSNVVKHSNASNVWIVVREHPAFYQLSVSDNGTDIDDKLDGGIGLENMHERVSSLGGTFSINKKNGFTVFLSIPKNKG